MDIKAFGELWNSGTIVELGHILRPNIPVWPTHARFMMHPWETKEAGAIANHFFVAFGDHNGTHVDSSFHYIERESGSSSIDEYPADKFCGPCCVLHYHGMAAGDTVEKEDILAWEAAHGPIQKGDIVLFDFDWARKFQPIPAGEAFLAGWPGLGKSGAECLLERGVKLVGVDPCSVDILHADNDPAHHALLPHDVLIMECLANLDQLPDRAFFMALPLRLQGGSGSPVRAIAIY